jgi:hypothetical protein
MDASAMLIPSYADILSNSLIKSIKPPQIDSSHYYFFTSAQITILEHNGNTSIDPHWKNVYYTCKHGNKIDDSMLLQIKNCFFGGICCIEVHPELSVCSLTASEIIRRTGERSMICFINDNFHYLVIVIALFRLL